jgi:hypothetical protein
MLTPYWRSGRFSGVLPVANGGTGASVRIFVDTINTQTVNGAKTFTNETHVNNNLRVDSKTLFVDETLNSVAIGHDSTNSSFYKLDIRETNPLNFSALYTGTSTTGLTSLAIQTQSNNAFSNGKYILMTQNAFTHTGTLYGDSRASMALIEAYEPSVIMIGTSASAPIKFATNNGFPFIAKPINGNDSLHVKKISNTYDLQKYFNDRKQWGVDVSGQNFENGVLLESFVQGTEFCLDLLKSIKLP